MKHLLLLLLVVTTGHTSLAQRTVAIHNLWIRPQVHVLFEGYTLSFTIKDIDRALELLAATGNTYYGDSSGLDTAQTYALELYRGTTTIYKNRLQPLMQNGIGVFLLLAGHAYIHSPKHKALKEIIADIQPPGPERNDAYIHFYDPKTNKLIFSGKMPVSMYNQDLGID